MTWSQWYAYLIGQVADANACAVLHSYHIFTLLVHGCPEHPLSLTDVTPLSNMENKSATYVLLIVSSPKASCDFSRFLLYFCMVGNRAWCRYTDLWRLQFANKVQIAEDTASSLTGFYKSYMFKINSKCCS